MLLHILSLLQRARRKVIRDGVRRLFSFDLLTACRIDTRIPREKIGSNYGGWIIPQGWLGENSICYCLGVGEDITFDLGLIERFGCDVYGFDPTPRAIAHVQRVAANIQKYHFSAIGIWKEETILKFYAPRNPGHVSHSVVNLQGTTEYFEAHCRRLSNIMRDNDHESLDLLKLDIEGAEYEVLNTLLTDRIRVKVLCVEYDEAFNPQSGDYKRRIRESVQRLSAAGFKLIAVDGIANMTFVCK